MGRTCKSKRLRSRRGVRRTKNPPPLGVGSVNLINYSKYDENDQGLDVIMFSTVYDDLHQRFCPFFAQNARKNLFCLGGQKRFLSFDGGGGSRTRVRKDPRNDFYRRSPRFFVSRLEAPADGIHKSQFPFVSPQARGRLPSGILQCLTPSTGRQKQPVEDVSRLGG